MFIAPIFGLLPMHHLSMWIQTLETRNPQPPVLLL